MNSRNPSNGIVTPITTPTSTSEGASTPRCMRARATRATTAAAVHLPTWRQRPSGTRAYKIPTKVTESAAICSDGKAHAYQSVRNTTPNGRGRRSTGPSRYWMISPCRVHAMTTTSRWRNRLRINSASNRPHSSTVIAAHEPGAANTSIIAVRPDPSRPASQSTTASSTTVTATAGPRSSPVKTTTDSATSTTVALIQPTPVVWRGCGNGGGRPDGRRRRDERPIPAEPGGTTPPATPTAWVKRSTP